MQKPRFKTTEKAAWVFVNTVLNKRPVRTLDRRTALRSGYLTTAARLLGKTEKDLPLPFRGESMGRYVDRVKSAGR